MTVAGRVIASGRGVRGATVSITNTQGEVVNMRSGVNGAFIFEDVEPGMIYVVRVASRRFQFAARVLQVNDSIADLEMVAEN